MSVTQKINKPGTSQLSVAGKSQNIHFGFSDKIFA